MESRELSGSGAEGKSVEEVQAMFGQMLASLPVDEYPNLVRLVTDDDPGSIDDDGQFEYGLQRMLDGMEADLKSPVGPA